MASTNKTNRGLNIWVETDIPEMEDFNTDNQIIDTMMESVSQAAQSIETLQGNFINGKATTALRADIAITAQNGASNRLFELGTTDWRDSTAFIEYPFEAEILAGDILETDNAMVLLSAQSVAAARAAGIDSGMGQTDAGAIRIFAEKLPGQPLVGSYIIVHKEG